MQQRQLGFTLAEVLIALMIFSLIATASVYALRLGVDSRDQLSAADDRLKKLQIARILIKEDLAQVVSRPVRDEFGSLRRASFLGGEFAETKRTSENEEILVSFVRGGWLNVNALSPRSALQHVQYVFRDGALIRRARVYLDEAKRSDVTERILFHDVAEVQAEYLVGVTRKELDWIDEWPVPGAVGQAPKAIAITIETEDKNSLRQLFWIGDLSTGGAE